MSEVNIKEPHGNKTSDPESGKKRNSGSIRLNDLASAYETRELVAEQFEKSEQDVKDGMDISLVSLQFPSPKERDGRLRLSWAGANNPLWIIRDGAQEIEEIKPDKQPIGAFFNPKPFTTHTVLLNSGDTIYVFTDGYQDQFGGKDNKKYKASNFKKLLINSKKAGMQDQRQILDKAFETWRGATEQIDDV